MTKKDYQAVARALYTAVKPHTYVEHGAQMFAREAVAWMDAVQGIADAMAQDSPRFDRARFLEACETGTTRGMRK
jgi:hypothetical protein